MLLVGIDLGDLSKVVGINDSYGNNLVKPFKLSMDKSGFDKMIKRVDEECKKKKQEATYLIESTNNFWMSLYYYLEEKGKKVRLVDSYDSHQINKIQSNSAKTDSNDSIAIAKVPLMENKKKVKSVPNMLFHELRRYVRLRDCYSKNIGKVKNKIVSSMKIVFHGLLRKDIFSNNFCKSARFIMKNYTSPNKILEEDEDKLIEFLRRESRNQLSLEKIIKIIEKAKVDIGLKDNIQGYIYEVRDLLDVIEFLEMKIEKIDHKLEQNFKFKVVENLLFCRLGY